MTRDFILGLLLSAALHLVLFSDLWTPAPRVRTAVAAEEPKTRLIPFPVMLKEPEIVASNEVEVRKLDLAPPMQPDAPQPLQIDSFVQPIQPPPPEGVTISATMTTVPDVRDARAFSKIEVFDPAMLDQVPVPKFQARPQYPFDMRRNGISGEVVVDFIVDPNGEVQNAHAWRSTQREFEAAAVLAVSKWKFRPGRKAGRDVPTHMQVPIVFRLGEE